MINKIIRRKRLLVYIEDRCDTEPLTLEDLQTIAEAFQNALSEDFDMRVEYVDVDDAPPPVPSIGDESQPGQPLRLTLDPQKP